MDILYEKRETGAEQMCSMQIYRVLANQNAVLLVVFARKTKWKK